MRNSYLVIYLWKWSRQRELHVQRCEVKRTWHRSLGLWVVNCGWHVRWKGRSIDIPGRWDQLMKGVLHHGMSWIFILKIIGSQWQIFLSKHGWCNQTWVPLTTCGDPPTTLYGNRLEKGKSGSRRTTERLLQESLQEILKAHQGIVMVGSGEVDGSFRCFGHYISFKTLAAVKDSSSTLGGITY